MDSSSSSSFKAHKVFFTPLACLRLLTERGHVFDVEMREMKNEEHPEYRKRRWRADIWETREAKIRGTGEAPRKMLAKNAAILDLLDALRQAWPREVIPECKMPLGVRISPQVMLALTNHCEKNNLGSPYFSSDLIPFNGHDKFKTSITVGKSTFTAVSYEERYAKLHASLKAFIELSGRKFKLDVPYMGDDCLDINEFLLIECDQNHIVTAKYKSLQLNLERLPGLTNSRKRSLPESATGSVAFPAILKKIRKSMSERDAASVNSERRSESRCESRSSTCNGALARLPPLPPIVISPSISGRSFGETNGSLELEKLTEDSFYFSSNEDAIIDSPMKIDDDAFLITEEPFTRPKQIAVRKLNLNQQSVILNPPASPSAMDSIPVEDVVGSKLEWEARRGDVLKNLEALEDMSDSEDDDIEGNFTSVFVATSIGFGEELYLADYKSGLNLQSIVQTSTEVINQLQTD